MTDSTCAATTLVPSDVNGQPPGDDCMIDVILEGGPADMAREMRLPRCRLAGSVLKIQRWGGYEHFECVDEKYYPDNHISMNFRWTFRTKIAE
jgi:Family of unknown function (DUF5988)